MALAKTPTLLPLDRAAEVLGISPLHFNGVRSQYIHDESYCDGVWFQEAYQRADRFSREDLARLLAVAEETVAKYLGYWPMPRWVEEEEHQLTQFVRVEVPSYYNSRGMRKSILTRWGHVIEGGIRATSLIEGDAVISYTDEDSDGYFETATITVDLSTIDDRQEVRVFYPGYEAAVQWEIRPVDVDLDAGTITFKREQCVLENLLYRMPPPDDPMDAVDGDDDANFLTTADVYRVYNDPSQQVVFYMEPDFCNTEETTQTGYLNVRDSRRGFVAYWPGTYDDGWTNATLCAPPLRARFWYRAGKKNLYSETPELQMDYTLERLLVYYALSLSDKAICGCDNFSSHLAYELQDLAEVGDTKRFQVTFKQMDCPLGTKRAAIRMWDYIQQNKLGGSLRKGV